MKRTRLWSIFLLGAVLLSGCGGNVAEATDITTAATAATPPANTTAATTEASGIDIPDINDWKEDGTLKILTIGNSFSDDTMEYVWQIADDLGIRAKLGNLYIGGCTLNTHATNAKRDEAAYEYRTNSRGSWSTVNNYKLSDAIRSENWDYISLQQASGSSGVARSYSQLEYLIGYVKELCPDAGIVWNMTWAYQQDSTHSEFPNYQSDQTTMYNAILDAVEEKVRPQKEIFAVIPTGTAIQNARTSYIGDHLTRDGYHLTYDLGRYIAGLTFVHGLTGMSVENVTYAPDGVDDTLQKIAIESAMHAVQTPGSVTASGYTVEPAFDESKYTKLELDWTALGYWNSTDASNHHKIITGASNSKQFYASRTFTKDELPVGSVIEVAEGWQYRPEGWKSGGVQSGRPGTTSVRRVTVTKAWWGDYTARAFNLSKVGTPSLESAAGEIATAFTVWIPKG